MSTNKTTADLRERLFDSIDAVKAGTLDPKNAAQIANLAKVMIDSARLELDHSKTLSQLDKDNQNVATGPMLLGKVEMEQGS